MNLGLDSRVYLLTGATRGLGRATAEMLVADGARVVVSSRDQEAVEHAAAALGGETRAVGVVADNADPAAPERLVAAAATYVAEDGHPMTDARHPAYFGLVDATDRLHGLAEGLAELRQPQDPWRSSEAPAGSAGTNR